VFHEARINSIMMRGNAEKSYKLNLMETAVEIHQHYYDK